MMRMTIKTTSNGKAYNVMQNVAKWNLIIKSFYMILKYFPYINITCHSGLPKDMQ